MSKTAPLLSRQPLSTAQLRHFVLVAESGSYSIAAKRANRSQSAVSLSIRELEERLALNLFEPAARTTLTAFGEQCLPLVKALVLQEHQVADSLWHLARGVGGTLRIACVGTAHRLFLSPLLRQFASQFPQLGIALFDYQSTDVERAVLSGEVDFGLCTPVHVDARLEHQMLLSHALGLVCTQMHPLARRKSLKWADLQGFALVGSPVHELVVELPAADILQGCKHYASHIRPMLELLQLFNVATVMGPQHVPMEQSDLRFIPLTDPTIKIDLALVKLRGRTLLPHAAALAAMIVDHAPELAINQKLRGKPSRCSAT